MLLEVEQYIQKFDLGIQTLLIDVRNFIIEIDSSLEEKYSYGIPAYYLKGKPIVYIGAFKHHIGVYALPNTHKQFAVQLKGYKQGKGSVQFPYSQEFPFHLLKEMVQFNIQQQLVTKKR